tara:strand:+ start:390 stop:542 length:153 start_codon:yes stop_codon:yes gene_type:complete
MKAATNIQTTLPMHVLDSQRSNFWHDLGTVVHSRESKDDAKSLKKMVPLG